MYLVFAELSSQSGDVMSGLCDLRLKSGRISKLRVLLINALHLHQSLADGQRDELSLKEHLLCTYMCVGSV